MVALLKAKLDIGQPAMQTSFLCLGERSRSAALTANCKRSVGVRSLCKSWNYGNIPHANQEKT